MTTTDGWSYTTSGAKGYTENPRQALEQILKRLLAKSYAGPKNNEEKQAILNTSGNLVRMALGYAPLDSQMLEQGQLEHDAISKAISLSTEVASTLYQRGLQAAGAAPEEAAAITEQMRQQGKLLGETAKKHVRSEDEIRAHEGQLEFHPDAMTFFEYNGQRIIFIPDFKRAQYGLEEHNYKAQLDDYGQKWQRGLTREQKQAILPGDFQDWADDPNVRIVGSIIRSEDLKKHKTDTPQLNYELTGQHVAETDRLLEATIYTMNENFDEKGLGELAAAFFSGQDLTAAQKTLLRKVERDILTNLRAGKSQHSLPKAILPPRIAYKSDEPAGPYVPSKQYDTFMVNTGQFEGDAAVRVRFLNGKHMDFAETADLENYFRQNPAMRTSTLGFTIAEKHGADATMAAVTAIISGTNVDPTKISTMSDPIKQLIGQRVEKAYIGGLTLTRGMPVGPGTYFDSFREYGPGNIMATVFRNGAYHPMRLRATEQGLSVDGIVAVPKIETPSTERTVEGAGQRSAALRNYKNQIPPIESLFQAISANLDYRFEGMAWAGTADTSPAGNVVTHRGVQILGFDPAELLTDSGQVYLPREEIDMLTDEEKHTYNRFLAVPVKEWFEAVPGWGIQATSGRYEAGRGSQSAIKLIKGLIKTASRPQQQLVVSKGQGDLLPMQGTTLSKAQIEAGETGAQGTKGNKYRMVILGTGAITQGQSYVVLPPGVEEARAQAHVEREIDMGEGIVWDPDFLEGKRVKTHDGKVYVGDRHFLFDGKLTTEPVFVPVSKQYDQVYIEPGSMGFSQKGNDRRVSLLLIAESPQTSSKPGWSKMSDHYLTTDQARTLFGADFIDQARGDFQGALRIMGLDLIKQSDTMLAALADAIGPDASERIHQLYAGGHSEEEIIATYNEIAREAVVGSGVVDLTQIKGWEQMEGLRLGERPESVPWVAMDALMPVSTEWYEGKTEQGAMAAEQARLFYPDLFKRIERQTEHRHKTRSSIMRAAALMKGKDRQGEPAQPTEGETLTITAAEVHEAFTQLRKDGKRFQAHNLVQKLLEGRDETDRYRPIQLGGTEIYLPSLQALAQIATVDDSGKQVERVNNEVYRLLRSYSVRDNTFRAEGRQLEIYTDCLVTLAESAGMDKAQQRMDSPNAIFGPVKTQPNIPEAGVFIPPHRLVEMVPGLRSALRQAKGQEAKLSLLREVYQSLADEPLYHQRYPITDPYFAMQPVRFLNPFDPSNNMADVIQGLERDAMSKQLDVLVSSSVANISKEDYDQDDAGLGFLRGVRFNPKYGADPRHNIISRELVGGKRMDALKMQEYSLREYHAAGILPESVRDVQTAMRYMTVVEAHATGVNFPFDDRNQDEILRAIEGDEYYNTLRVISEHKGQQLHATWSDLGVLAPGYVPPTEPVPLGERPGFKANRGDSFKLADMDIDTPAFIDVAEATSAAKSWLPGKKKKSTKKPRRRFSDLGHNLQDVKFPEEAVEEPPSGVSRLFDTIKLESPTRPVSPAEQVLRLIGFTPQRDPNTMFLNIPDVTEASKQYVTSKKYMGVIGAVAPPITAAAQRQLERGVKWNEGLREIYEGSKTVQAGYQHKVDLGVPDVPEELALAAMGGYPQQSSFWVPSLQAYSQAGKDPSAMFADAFSRYTGRALPDELLKVLDESVQTGAMRMAKLGQRALKGQTAGMFDVDELTERTPITLMGLSLDEEAVAKKSKSTQALLRGLNELMPKVARTNLPWLLSGSYPLDLLEQFTQQQKNLPTYENPALPGELKLGRMSQGEIDLLRALEKKPVAEVHRIVGEALAPAFENPKIDPDSIGTPRKKATTTEAVTETTAPKVDNLMGMDKLIAVMSEMAAQVGEQTQALQGIFGGHDIKTTFESYAKLPPGFWKHMGNLAGGDFDLRSMRLAEANAGGQFNAAITSMMGVRNPRSALAVRGSNMLAEILGGVNPEANSAQILADVGKVARGAFGGDSRAMVGYQWQVEQAQNLLRTGPPTSKEAFEKYQRVLTEMAESYDALSRAASNLERIQTAAPQLDLQDTIEGLKKRFTTIADVIPALEQAIDTYEPADKTADFKQAVTDIGVDIFTDALSALSSPEAWRDIGKAKKVIDAVKPFAEGLPDAVQTQLATFEQQYQKARIQEAAAGVQPQTPTTLLSPLGQAFTRNATPDMLRAVWGIGPQLAQTVATQKGVTDVRDIKGVGPRTGPAIAQGLEEQAQYWQLGGTDTIEQLFKTVEAAAQETKGYGQAVRRLQQIGKQSGNVEWRERVLPLIAKAQEQQNLDMIAKLSPQAPLTSTNIAAIQDAIRQQFTGKANMTEPEMALAMQQVQEAIKKQGLTAGAFEGTLGAIQRVLTHSDVTGHNRESMRSAISFLEAEGFSALVPQERRDEAYNVPPSLPGSAPPPPAGSGTSIARPTRTGRANVGTPRQTTYRPEKPIYTDAFAATRVEELRQQLPGIDYQALKASGDTRKALAFSWASGDLLTMDPEESALIRELLKAEQATARQYSKGGHITFGEVGALPPNIPLGEPLTEQVVEDTRINTTRQQAIETALSGQMPAAKGMHPRDFQAISALTRGSGTAKDVERIAQVRGLAQQAWGGALPEDVGNAINATPFVQGAVADVTAQIQGFGVIGGKQALGSARKLVGQAETLGLPANMLAPLKKQIDDYVTAQKTASVSMQQFGAIVEKAKVPMEKWTAGMETLAKDLMDKGPRNLTSAEASIMAEARRGATAYAGLVEKAGLDKSADPLLQRMGQAESTAAFFGMKPESKGVKGFIDRLGDPKVGFGSELFFTMRNFRQFLEPLIASGTQYQEYQWNLNRYRMMGGQAPDSTSRMVLNNMQEMQMARGRTGGYIMAGANGMLGPQGLGAQGVADILGIGGATVGMGLLGGQLAHLLLPAVATAGPVGMGLAMGGTAATLAALRIAGEAKDSERMQGQVAAGNPSLANMYYSIKDKGYSIGGFYTAGDEYRVGIQDTLRSGKATGAAGHYVFDANGAQEYEQFRQDISGGAEGDQYTARSDIARTIFNAPLMSGLGGLSDEQRGRILANEGRGKVVSNLIDANIVGLSPEAVNQMSLAYVQATGRNTDIAGTQWDFMKMVGEGANYQDFTARGLLPQTAQAYFEYLSQTQASGAKQQYGLADFSPMNVSTTQQASMQQYYRTASNLGQMGLTYDQNWVATEGQLPLQQQYEKLMQDVAARAYATPMATEQVQALVDALEQQTAENTTEVTGTRRIGPSMYLPGIIKKDTGVYQPDVVTGVNGERIELDTGTNVGATGQRVEFNTYDQDVVKQNADIAAIRRSSDVMRYTEMALGGNPWAMEKANANWGAQNQFTKDWYGEQGLPFMFQTQTTRGFQTGYEALPEAGTPSGNAMRYGWELNGQEYQGINQIAGTGQIFEQAMHNAFIGFAKDGIAIPITHKALDAMANLGEPSKPGYMPAWDTVMGKGTQQVQREAQAESYHNAVQQMSLQFEDLADKLQYVPEQLSIQRQQFQLGVQQQREEQARSWSKFSIQWGQGLEDINRNYGRQQTQFGWQETALDFQQNQSQVGFAFNMEESQEALKYATGRDRRKILRQQEQSVVQFSMGQAQIDEQRQQLDTRRQWAAEDYQIALQRHQQQLTWETERFSASQRYFEQETSLRQRAMEIEQTLTMNSLDRNQRSLQIAQQHLRVTQAQSQYLNAAQITLQNMGASSQLAYNVGVKSLDVHTDLKTAGDAANTTMSSTVGYMRQIASITVPGRVQQKALGGPTFAPTLAMLSEFGQEEHVVPSGGALVSRDPRVVAVLERILEALEGSGGQNIFNISTNESISAVQLKNELITDLRLAI